ncbi:MAG: hypothetical protein HYV07_11325 [Deltaproteobacteria bacterium]|nr:hypothetical protein [Deltaproteobacteria bacterium]
MKPAPIAVVKKSFGNKQALLEKLLPLVDDLNQEGQDKLKSRLSSLPNKKLLRLYQVEQKVRERFGDRAKLIDFLVSARKTAGLTADDSFRTKLASFSKAQLLDMSRQSFGERPKKLTPEQRLAQKNGRKERERALRKLGKNA